METFNLLVSITPVPFLSILIWIVLSILTLYLVRKTFHRVVMLLGRTVYKAMRLASRSIQWMENRLQARNREVLLAAGTQLVEAKVEREFDRMSEAVQRDLENLPKIQRNLSEMLTQLHEDHSKSSEVPPVLPDWGRVIDKVASLPAEDTVVASTLQQIHKGLEEQHAAILSAHRQNIAERHAILTRMRPLFLRIQKKMGQVDKSVSGLAHRAGAIDRHMERYEKIRSQSDDAVRQLAASSLIQLVVAVLALSVLALGAIVNFNLIALPMSEMVGGTSYIGSFKTSNVAAVFMISLQVIVGFFLMDALRMTHFFTIFASFTRTKRKHLLWGILCLLTLLALVESSLVVVRDRMMADLSLLRQSLSGIEANDPIPNIVPTIGYMVMGFILPFVLAFTAVPFEALIRSLRTLLGMIVCWLLRFVAFTLRIAGHLGLSVARLTVRVYDMVIFPAIWVESAVGRKLVKTVGQERRRADAEDEPEEEGVGAMEG